MSPKLTVAQRRAVKEWQNRTRPGRNYSIGEVFPARNNVDNVHRRAILRLVAQDIILPGIPGGCPLKEA